MEDEGQVTGRHFSVSDAPDEIPVVKLLSAIAVRSTARLPRGRVSMFAARILSSLNCSRRHKREAYTFLRLSRKISAASIGFTAGRGGGGTISARRSVTSTFMKRCSIDILGCAGGMRITWERTRVIRLPSFLFSIKSAYRDSSGLQRCTYHL